MNPLSNTPPDGDFARYVEQLMSRAAVQRRTNENDQEMDVGMVPSAEMHRAPASNAQQTGAQAGAPGTADARPIDGPMLAKVLGLGWALAILVALAVGAGWLIVAGMVALGLWVGYQLRKLPSDGARLPALRKLIEDAARRQQAQNQQRRRP